MDITSISLIIAGSGIVITVFLLLFARKKFVDAHRLLKESQEKLQTNKQEVENERREALLKVKDELYRRRTEFDAEIKRERADLDRLQSKLGD